MQTMLTLFRHAPGDVRGGLMAAALRHPGVFARAVTGLG
jgi:hypothetical protein